MLKFKKVYSDSIPGVISKEKSVRYEVYRNGGLLHKSLSNEDCTNTDFAKTISLEAIDYIELLYNITLTEDEKQQIKEFFQSKAEKEKPKTDSFVGTGSGDCECFCWDVDLETYKKYHRGWEEDVKERQQFNVDQGYPQNQGVFDGTWRLYVQDIERLLDLKRKKYKITLTFEEADDEI